MDKDVPDRRYYEHPLRRERLTFIQRNAWLLLYSVTAVILYWLVKR